MNEQTSWIKMVFWLSLISFVFFSGGNKYLNWQRFFFHDLRTRVFDNLNKREAGNGQWRTIEKAQDFELSKEQVVARKNVLAFWEAKGNGFAKSNWVMHEFRLVSKSHPSMVNNTTISIIIVTKNYKHAFPLFII